MIKNMKFLLPFTIGLSLSLTMVANAAYVPPQDQVPPRTRGGTAGRRSTCAVSAVTPLAPISYLGKTIQARPTFYWITNANGNEGIPLEFSLMEYHPETEQLVVKNKQQIISESAIDRFTLPEQWQELEPGKLYAWQVVALCGAPSANPYLRAAVQRVMPSPILENKLQGSDDPIAQIQAYGAAGIWYDSLDLARQPSQTNNQRLARIGMQLIKDLAIAEKQREPLEMELEYRHSYLLETMISVSYSPKL